MALPIRPNSGVTPKSKPAVRSPRPKVETEELSLPSLGGLEPEPARKLPVKTPRQVIKKPEPVIEHDDGPEEGWAIDEKTGVKYKTIPKSVFKGKGKNAIPMLAIEDFDADNMTGEAETYLGHLRIPPDKAEQERLKQVKAQMRKRSDAAYAENNKDELTEKDQIVEEVVTEQPKQSFMQKLAGLFR